MFNKKEWSKKYRLANPEKIKAGRKKWDEANLERRRITSKRWSLANPEKVKARDKRYRLAHPEKIKEKNRKLGNKWALAHPREAKKIHSRYWLSVKGRKVMKKHRSKRRQLGFIPLNEPFTGCSGHHIDKEQVIYVPTKMHENNRHSVTLNRNMDTINKLAFEFLYKRRICELNVLPVAE